jgi:DNA-damage-inducible protein D
LRRDNVQGKENANATHYAVGAKVRQTIKDLGGTMPEELPTPDKSIKQIEREQNKPAKYRLIPPQKMHIRHNLGRESINANCMRGSRGVNDTMPTNRKDGCLQSSVTVENPITGKRVRSTSTAIPSKRSPLSAAASPPYL